MAGFLAFFPHYPRHSWVIIAVWCAFGVSGDGGCVEGQTKDLPPQSTGVESSVVWLVAPPQNIEMERENERTGKNGSKFYNVLF